MLKKSVIKWTGRGELRSKREDDFGIELPEIDCSTSSCELAVRQTRLDSSQTIDKLNETTCRGKKVRGL